jgi:hypothetical protein
LDVAGTTLEQVCLVLSFLMPPTQRLLAGDEFLRTWPPAGPWSVIDMYAEGSAR